MEILEQLVLTGPNRRSERTVIELRLEASEEDCRILESSAEDVRTGILQTLARSGVEPPVGHPLHGPLPAGAVETYAQFLGAAALALQQSAGHRVSFMGVYPLPGENLCRVAFEYEQGDAGIDACRLAVHLIGDAASGIRLPEMPIEDYSGFGTAYDAYLREAGARVLPRDAEAIVEAARRLDVPCAKLERDPYAGVESDFRVRPNGLLKLGHACRQRVVDGTFPIDSDPALAALVYDRGAVRRALESLGLPLARRGAESSVQMSASRAVRTAGRIGYPVVVTARRIPRPDEEARVAPALEDADAVRSAAQRLLRTSPGVLVESCVPGRTYRIIVADHAVVAVLAIEGGRAVADVTGQAHPTLPELAVEASRRLRVAIMTLTLVCADIRQPLQDGDAVVGLDIAPALDVFMPEEAPFAAREILDRAAEGLVRHLFPPGTKSRIPLVSVTGTNGKTTTSALIERIMSRAGYQTARAGTTGLFRNGQWLEFGDMSGGRGHHKVLESPEVELGVLETARGAVAGMGLAFDRCDVAVCTNVSSDHLGQRDIETVAQMAGLKEFIVQRARDAVVLNADNRYSAGMLPRLGGRQAWLVSAERAGAELLAEFGEGVNFCVAEVGAGGEWINLYPEGRKVPLMAVAEIPITRDGTVRYNVSNALQAIAACHQLGASADVMRSALSTFTPTFQDNPGRLNFYRELPFTVLVDSPHNAAGWKLLMEFVAAQEVEGRRLILFSATGYRTDAEIMDLAGLTAGHFDLYLCRNFPNLHGRRPEEVPALMKRGLTARGVPDSCVIEVPEGDAVGIALRACREGDLLLLCSAVKGLRDEWEAITSFGRREGAAPGP